MDPISNIAYLIQYLAIAFMLDPRKPSIIKSIKRTRSRPTCSFFGDLSIDGFLEVQNENLYLVDYIADGLHLLSKI